MKPANPRRKGWRSALRYAGLLVLAAIVALPVAFMAGMLMTPLLWRLEPVVGMELAGHSGPSDWILEAIFGIVVVLVFALTLRLTRPQPRAPYPADRASRPSGERW